MRRIHRAFLASIAAALLSALPAGADMAGEMVAAHNEVRAKVGIPPLSWSGELVAYAKEWAEHLRTAQRCKSEHRPRQGPFAQKYGENLHYSGAVIWSDGRRELQKTTAAEVVLGWAAEAADYDYATGRCSAVCGHYTQLVWRETKTVGCAMAVCEDTKEQIWVCNYDPAGNQREGKPY